MADDSRLRYLDAAHVDTPVGKLTAMTLVSPSEQEIGSLAGILFDLIERRVRYFVVMSRGWWPKRRYLLPATPTPIDAGRRQMRVDVEPDELQHLPTFQAGRFPSFSDEDLMATLFPTRAVLH